MRGNQCVSGPMRRWKNIALTVHATPAHRGPSTDECRDPSPLTGHGRTEWKGVGRGGLLPDSPGRLDLTCCVKEASTKKLLMHPRLRCGFVGPTRVHGRLSGDIDRRDSSPSPLQHPSRQGEPALPPSFGEYAASERKPEVSCRDSQTVRGWELLCLASHNQLTAAKTENGEMRLDKVVAHRNSRTLQTVNQPMLGTASECLK